MDQNTSMPSTPAEPMGMPEHPMRHQRAIHQSRENKGGGWKIAFIVLIIILVAGGIGGYFIKKSVIEDKGSYAKSENSAVWQAVFLANGQVYFGHLKERTAKYPLLTDIYYLQVNQQNLQSGDQNANSNTNTDATQPQISLIKLGEELHGPKDEMYIAKDQILFWEDLKDDSKVVQAIKDYKKK